MLYVLIIVGSGPEQIKYVVPNLESKFPFHYLLYSFPWRYNSDFTHFSF